MECRSVGSLVLLVSLAATSGCDLPVKAGWFTCDPVDVSPCPPGQECAWSAEHGEHRCTELGGTEPECGNGTVEQGEDCDGQDISGVTCQLLGFLGGTLACTDRCTLDDSGCDRPLGCGDGVLDPDEDCDGANLGGATCESQGWGTGTLACTFACRFDPLGCSDRPECGNGQVEYGEACDDGNAVGGDGCSADCRSDETCGNGIVDSAAWEACDDGNLTPGDGCSTDCRSDETCGNRIVDSAAGETCDDGNLTPGDGCSAECRLESCGNGVLDPGEVCDDGGVDTATCNANCTAARCGDGYVNGDAGEYCDDQGESATCDPDCTPKACGDSYVNRTGGEECDDGNTAPNDGCNSFCRIEPGCGNGIVESGLGEACDDGNRVSGDGCSADCQSDETCGNGIVDGPAGETCDDGGESATCDADCTAAACGDGVVNVSAGEACDDGGESATCDADCTAVNCGDGVVNVSAGEACDDGMNDGSYDGCLPGCAALGPRCDDGIVQGGAGEECDGGLGGENCSSIGLGFDGGTLVCESYCMWDTSGCTPATGLAWIPITGGNFSMGSTVMPDEQPIHTVTVPSFEMTETEVTVAQYQVCVSDGACTAPNTLTGCNWNIVGRVDHPVNCVDWNQAKAYCAWAGGRLPSEAEWEYAARSGGQSIDYPWGNAAATCTYAVMIEGTYGCGLDRTWSVCSKPGGNSAQGLCDLAGNVWEWVEDDDHADYTGAPVDGSAWVNTPRAAYRQRRGGGYDMPAPNVRAANRFLGGDSPVTRSAYLGFRCAR